MPTREFTSVSAPLLSSSAADAFFRLSCHSRRSSTALRFNLHSLPLMPNYGFPTILDRHHQLVSQSLLGTLVVLQYYNQYIIYEHEIVVGVGLSLTVSGSGFLAPSILRVTWVPPLPPP
ncbi:hypothetical protein TIFTF001_021016 [Ficus carica]|uniref:Uncharacterized protein n=1 Tax=Ficus carica TaxID=3494 RepID=A0AA88AUK5_FICCA|nr:hypothetical protein TIFTF001_021016 [Ficus carica]